MIPVLIAFISAGLVFAQPAFDVASIKPNLTDSHSSKIDRSTSRLIIENTSLRDIIAYASNIPAGRDYQLSGPGWIDTERFDILATYPANTARDKVREMTQRLLAERFGMRTHNETKEIESYVLVVTKKGAVNLKPNTLDDDGAFSYGPEHIVCRAISMTGFANRLSQAEFNLERPVVDQTDLKGAWNFELTWSAEGSPSFFTALQDQLGLKLDTKRLPFSIMVIDSLNRTPTEN